MLSRFLLISLLLCWPARVLSAPCPSGELKPKATAEASGLLCHEGALGQWFPAETAKKLLQDVTAGKQAILLQPKLEERIAVADTRADLLKSQYDSAQTRAKLWEDVAAQQAKAFERSNSIWRSPVLWFAVGVVVTSAGMATAIGLAK